jgi:hypothetical protein
MHAEEHDVSARAVDLSRERHNEPEEESDHHGRPREQVRALARPEEADADPEETAQQDEVGEIGQMHDPRAGPADRDQLHEQHQEARRHQLEAFSLHGRKLAVGQG